MKKIISTAIALLFIVAFGFFLLKEYNKEVPVGKDALSVEAFPPLSAEKVKIEYGFTTLSRKNDTELFKDRDRYKLFFDGTPKDSIRTVSGENDFLVTYNDKYYLSFRQLKKKRKFVHQYNFSISQPDSVPLLKVDIEGENEMHFEVPMIPIAMANKFVCNTPIKNAGIVYDFLKTANPDIPDEQKAKIAKEEDELLKKLGKVFQ